MGILGLCMYLRLGSYIITLPYLTNLRYSSFINHVRYLRLGTGDG